MTPCARVVPGQRAAVVENRRKTYPQAAAVVSDNHSVALILVQYMDFKPQHTRRPKLLNPESIL